MSDANIAIVERLYDALSARDAHAIEELFAPDVEIVQTKELPWGGHFRGRDGLFTFFITLAEHLDSRVTHEGLFAAGDHVVQRGRTRGTVRASGVEFDIAEVHVFELRDGRIVRFDAYIDTPAMTEVLGKR
jgi:ketosteroid isomerase-like protein